MNLYSNIKKKLNESDDYEANRNDIIKQAAEYLFNDVNGDWDESLPDYEKFTDYYMDLNKRDYNKAVKLAEQALGNYAEHHYYDRDFNNINKSGGLLELNDNHTMWELNNPTLDNSDSAWYLYDDIVTRKINDFKEETGEELYGCGRSGRHICVEPTFENCLNFYKLQEVQERLEQEAIDEFNNYRPEEFNESSMLKEEVWNDFGDKEYKGIKISIEKSDKGKTCYIPLQNDKFKVEPQTQFFNWKDTKKYIDKKLNESEKLKESDTSDITNKIKNDVGEIIRKHWSTIYSDEWFDKNDLIISLPGDYDKQEVVIDFKNRKEPYYLVNSNELKELKEDLKALGLKGLHIKTKIIKPSWEDRKYTELLSISYIYDDEPRKEIHEAENKDNKIYYFMVGICLDKNRPNAIKEDFADWPWTKIPYKLLDENWGVDKTKEEAVNWVKNYIADGVPGTFGIVTEATEPYEGFKEEIHNGNHNDMDWSDIQKGKLIYSAYKEDKNPESIKVIVDESQKLDESEEKVVTNLDTNNMVDELRKHFKNITNKNYIKNSLKMHLNKGFITKEEYNKLKEEYKLNESESNYQNGEFIEPKWFKDKTLYNEFKKFVDSQLSDGAIDDPDYVNTLSPEEYESLLVNTWMKDQEEIDMFEEHIKSGYYGEKAKSLVESDTESDIIDDVKMPNDPNLAIGDKIWVITYNNKKPKLHIAEVVSMAENGRFIGYHYYYGWSSLCTTNHGFMADLYKAVDNRDLSKDYLHESETEDYWDATELDRVGFMALLKFNNPEEHLNPSMQYIITNDNNEVYRFAMQGENEKNKDIGAKIEFRKYINKEESEKLKEAVELSYDDYYDFGNEDNEDELFCAQCGNPVKPDFCYVVDESDPHSEVYCWRCYEDLNESQKLNESISYASEKEIKDMTDEELEDYLKYLKDEMIYHTTKKKAEIEKEIEKITKILYDRDYYIDYSNPDVNTIKFDKDGNEITTKEDK